MPPILLSFRFNPRSLRGRRVSKLATLPSLTLDMKVMTLLRLATSMGVKGAANDGFRAALEKHWLGGISLFV